MSSIEKLSQKYKTPIAVQKYLRSLKYNREEKGETLRSAEKAVRLGTAHCLEACFVAAAILEHHGYPPLVLSFESKDQLDHVIYVFKKMENGVRSRVLATKVCTVDRPSFDHFAIWLSVILTRTSIKPGASKVFKLQI